MSDKTMDGTSSKACVTCGQSSDQLPLVTLEYRGRQLYLCPQHMPLLIHQPDQLIGRLPGAEALKPG